MAFEAVDASGGDTCFPQHPRAGEWETLKGRMLSPMIQDPMESVAEGDSRHIDNPATLAWDACIIVDTPLTPGGGAMAK